MIPAWNWMNRLVHRVVLTSLIFLIPAFLFISTTSDASAQAIVINFDQDAAGNDIPSGEAIDDEYATLGVTFDGAYSVCRTADCRPDLPQNSSLNILCTAALGASPAACVPPVGGNATLVINLDNAVDFFSIDGYTATGERDADSILVQAFNAGRAIVGEARVVCDNGAAPYAEAGVCQASISGPGITKIFITPLTALNGLDNLILGSGDVPEPEPDPTADLQVAVTGPTEPVSPGDAYDYTITVTNGGPDAAVNVVLTDTLPTGVTVVQPSAVVASSISTVTPSVGTCSDGLSGVVTCSLGDLANGATATVTIQVVVDAGTTGSLVNAAVVGSDTADPVPANSQASQSTSISSPVAASADLSVTNSSAPNPVRPGGELIYTVNVDNFGPDGATNVTVTDSLPDQVSFVSAVPTQGTCEEANGTVTCAVGDIANGSGASVVIVTQVSATVTGTFSNLAFVGSDTVDTEAGNNQALVDTTVETVAVVESADLSIEQSGSANPVMVGDTLSYTLDIANLGPSNAVSATVTNSLPTQVTYSASSASQGSCSESAGTVTCAMGDLANNATASVTIVVTVNADATGSFSNAATVSADTSDPSALNNASTVTTTVAADAMSADLAITQSDSPAVVKPGTELVYMLDVVNNGPDDAAQVVVTDLLPEGTTFVAADPNAPTCTHAAGTVTCELGDLALDEQVTMTITVTVNDDAQGPFISNEATVTSGTVDPDLTNNQAIEQTEIEPLAIDLAQFTAISESNGVTLQWETGSEINVEGFNVWRSDAIDGTYVKVNERLISATGGSDAGSTYTYTDTSANQPDIYYYRLEEVDSAANGSLNKVIAVNTFPVQAYLPMLIR